MRPSVFITPLKRVETHNKGQPAAAHFTFIRHCLQKLFLSLFPSACFLFYHLFSFSSSSFPASSLCITVNNHIWNVINQSKAYWWMLSHITSTCIQIHVVYICAQTNVYMQYAGTDSPSLISMRICILGGHQKTHTRKQHTQNHC